MSDYNLILAGLDVYPSYRQITAASDYAKKIALEYITKIDPLALVIVDDGDVDIYSNCDFRDLSYNAQCIFDAAFAEKIAKIQAEA